jgi:predicted RNA-binding protein
MKTSKEERVLTAIQNDLLRELLKEKCTILSTLAAAIRKQEFSAQRYHEQECYEQLLLTKRAYNILKTFLEVCSHEEIDCP